MIIVSVARYDAKAFELSYRFFPTILLMFTYNVTFFFISKKRTFMIVACFVDNYCINVDQTQPLILFFNFQGCSSNFLFFLSMVVAIFFKSNTQCNLEAYFNFCTKSRAMHLYAVQLWSPVNRMLQRWKELSDGNKTNKGFERFNLGLKENRFSMKMQKSFYLQSELLGYVQTPRQCAVILSRSVYTLKKKYLIHISTDKTYRAKFVIHIHIQHTHALVGWTGQTYISFQPYL